MNKSPARSVWQQHAHESSMQRLIGALVRERLFPAGCQVEQLDAPFAAEIALRFPTQRKLLCVKQQKRGAKLYIPLGHTGAFRRFKLLSPIWFQEEQTWLHLDHFERLLELFRHRFGVDIPAALESELLNSLRFLIDGYQQRAQQQAHLRKQLAEYALVSMPYPEAIRKFKENVPFDEYLFSEALAVEGNPLHPCAKTRVGLTPSERQYLPESCSPIPIHILLIPKKDVHLTSVLTEDVHSFLFRLEPRLKEAAEQACEEKGVSLREFQLFFVHPWQFKHVIQKDYQPVISDWMLLPMTLESRALLSLRTMDVAQLGIHLKLPVRIQITNAVRTLSPQATVNGPLLSRLCNQLLAEKEDYSERVVVLPELVGAYYQRERHKDASFFARNLSYTIREHPRKYVGRGELAFVGAALTEKTPFGQPLLLELMQQAIGKREITADDGIRYLVKYARRVLPPFLYLLQTYGLALEGHMQNVIVVVKQGYVQRLLVRDMGGLRIQRKRFHEKIGDVGLRDGPIFVDDMTGVYNKFLHSVLQNQLGELIFVVADALKISEQPIWEEMAKIVLESLDRSTPEGQEDQRALFQPMIQTKALLAMRQQDRDAHDYLYIDLPNPLARSGRCVG